MVLRAASLRPRFRSSALYHPAQPLSLYLCQRPNTSILLVKKNCAGADSLRFEAVKLFDIVIEVNVFCVCFIVASFGLIGNMFTLL